MTDAILSAAIGKLREIVALGDDRVSEALDVETEPGVCVGDAVYQLRGLVETLIGPSTAPTLIEP